jgi:hypothetical protein
MNQSLKRKQSENPKLIPHIPLPFEEAMADVLKVKPPVKPRKPKPSAKHGTKGNPAKPA